MLGNCKIIVDEWPERLDPTNCADRIVDVVEDTCYNGVAGFLESARSVCKYNYQQLRKHNARKCVGLPERLAQYINE